MKEVTRQCSICKQLIYVQHQDEDFFVSTAKGINTYTHSSCYINHNETKKKCKLSYDDCVKYINECKKEQFEFLKREFARNELYNFLSDMYDVTFFPTYFFTKMESVFNGSYKGLKNPVPPDDLLDMWTQKKDMLLRGAEQARKKGTEITGVNRVYYDLAILLSRYDAYIKWKEQKKIALAEKNEQKKVNVEKIEYSDIVRPKTDKPKDNLVDISSMIDEV